VSRGRVLVVDDDVAMCDLLADTLRRRGFDVAPTPRAHDALAALDGAEVLVTDLNMAGMDGLALCERARELRPELPVVVITAFGSRETAALAGRAGAWELVEKPLDPDGFALALDRAVAHGRLQAEVRRLQALEREPASGEGALVSLEEVERRHILAVLARLGGSKSAAARVLGVDRATLYRKLERYRAR
jgi:two-component system response regulator HydG